MEPKDRKKIGLGEDILTSLLPGGDTISLLQGRQSIGEWLGNQVSHGVPSTAIHGKMLLDDFTDRFQKEVKFMVKESDVKDALSSKFVPDDLKETLKDELKAATNSADNAAYRFSSPKRALTRLLAGYAVGSGIETAKKRLFDRE